MKQSGFQSFFYGASSFFKERGGLIVIMVVFGVVYSAISLVNHYNFRTNSGDLGIYNQAIYDYAHFRVNFNTPWFSNKGTNILSDHFTLLQLLISPLYWVFKSYTLLVVQIVSILFGGLGIYKYIKLISTNEKLSLLALIHFFSFWGIYSALNFDYHDNVVATMFVPWIIYYLKKEKGYYVFLFFTLLIISRENMIIWGVFLCLGLLSVNYKNRLKRTLLFGLLVYSVVFLILTFTVFMPSLEQEVAGYTHFSFSVLGLTAKEAMLNIVKHPWDVSVSFFTNHLGMPRADGVKNEFFLTLILSGGLILLRKPQYLLVLLPIFGQKLFHDTYTHWGLSYHYSIEFAPIITIALFEYFSEIKYKYVLSLALIASLLCFSINIIKIEERLPSWHDNVGLAFYAKKHYETAYDVNEIQKVLDKIPRDAKVSAEFNIVPHLAARKYIYQFPRVSNADYIVLCPSDSNSYPMNERDYEITKNTLLNSYLWKLEEGNESVLLFRKTLNTGPSEKEIKEEVQKIKSNKIWMGGLEKESIASKEPIAEVLREKAIFIIKKKNENIRGVIKTGQNPIISDVLRKIKNRNLVIIAVKDEAATKMPLFFSATLDSLYHSNISELKVRESYIAVFNEGELIYEDASFSHLRFLKNINNTFVSITSVGGFDWESIVASIKLDGLEYSLNERGLNIVTLDSLGNSLSYNFDTYGKNYLK